MTTTPEHLRLAQQFRRFIEEANPLALPGEQIELAVAACYWSSLHYIDALLAFPEVFPDEDRHPDRDGHRRKVMGRIGPMTRKLTRHYRFLNDKYYDLVYRGERITTNDFELEVIDSYKEIVATCERVLRSHGDL